MYFHFCSILHSLATLVQNFSSILFNPGFHVNSSHSYALQCLFWFHIAYWSQKEQHEDQMEMHFKKRAIVFMVFILKPQFFQQGWSPPHIIKGKALCYPKIHLFWNAQLLCYQLSCKLIHPWFVIKEPFSPRDLFLASNDFRLSENKIWVKGSHPTSMPCMCHLLVFWLAFIITIIMPY